MKNTHPPISLKIYAYGINKLHDPNWTGMELYDFLKQHVRGRIEPKNLLRKPLEKGLPYHIGIWIYESFFDLYHFENLKDEYKYWFIDDLVEMLEHHGCNEKDISISSVKGVISNINDYYEKSEELYFEYLESEAGVNDLFECYQSLLSSYGDVLEKLKLLYSEDFSDRMVHDRQLCYYVSNLIVLIGFDGDNDESGPRKWVDRPNYWPKRVEAILRSRDRGKCSSCNANLVLELEDIVHIDHMIPIVNGGCNDIVNLQILCSKCNLNKSSKVMSALSSIPTYIQRKAPNKRGI